MEENKISLVDEVVEKIFHKIATRELKEGDKLPSEPKLAEMMHVSRNTIRSALGKLNGMGSVETIHGSGSYIRQTARESGPTYQASEENLSEIIQLLVFRKSLEPGAAYLAAENYTPDDIREMYSALQDMVENRQDVQKYGAADTRFHLAVAKATKNEYFYQATRNILYPLNESFTEMPMIVGLELNVRDHKALFSAIEQRNAALAQHLMSRLIDCSLHVLLHKTSI